MLVPFEHRCSKQFEWVRTLTRSDEALGKIKYVRQVVQPTAFAELRVLLLELFITGLRENERKLSLNACGYIFVCRRVGFLN